MKSISILLCLLVAGCATCTPEIIREPVEVRIPVSVRCVKAAIPKPNWIMDNAVVARSNVFEKGTAALQELEQRRQYERLLEAAIAACLNETQ